MLQGTFTSASTGLLGTLWDIMASGTAPAGLILLVFLAGALFMAAVQRVLWKAPVVGSDPIATAPAATDSARTREPVSAESLGGAIAAAVRAGELVLHYQPKLDCRTMKLRGAEALSRWTLPDGTRLIPDEFVAQAEAVGGISELTVWGVEQALRDSRWLAGKGMSGSLGGPIFVNLSGKLITRDFASRLIALVGDEAASIGFEITETAVLDNPEEALECLHHLREAGIALAIDDYGAGLSSLSYLKQIPAGELKIDRKFVQGMTRSNRDPLIVRSTIDLCHGLGMTVTAEGVEDAMTASLLGVMGCDTIQGYFVSRAVPIEGLARFIEEHPGTAPRVPQIRKKAGSPRAE